jgi:hypothetical protein
MTTGALEVLEEQRQRNIRWFDEAKARRVVAQAKVEQESMAMWDRAAAIEDLDKAIAALTYSTDDTKP